MKKKQFFSSVLSIIVSILIMSSVVKADTINVDMLYRNAYQATQKALNEKTQASINEARLAIKSLPHNLNWAIGEFSKQVDKVQQPILVNIINSIKTAEKTPNQANVNKAKKSIPVELTPVWKNSYSSAIDKIQQGLMNKALEAVKIAEDYKTNTSINNAREIVNDVLTADSTEIREWAKNLSNILDSIIIIPNFYDGAIVTFIDDDCNESVSKWEAIANEKGIKLSFAVVKDWVGTNGYCNLEKIKSLQNNGHDILNHTKSHINNWNITDSEIRTEIEENIKFMKENGLNGYDILVYPGTVPNESRYKNITRETCRYGIANTYQPTNKVQDSFYMNRIDSDFKTLDQLKSIVDQAIIDKQWVLVLTHSWREDGDVNSTKTFSIEKIKQLIDYIKSKNVPILKFTDAEQYKGNSISIGEFNNK